MKNIDPSIVKAFANLRREYASNAELAAALGVSGSLISRVLAGRAKQLNDATWARVEPLLRPHFRPICWHGLSLEECVLSQNSSVAHLVDNIRDIPTIITRERWFVLLNTLIDQTREQVNDGRIT